MQRVWQKIQKSLELPAELLGREPKVAFYPLQKKIIVENPIRLLIYEKEKVVVEIVKAKARLVITGKNLQLNLLLPDSLEIYGDLSQFEVESHG